MRPSMRCSLLKPAVHVFRSSDKTAAYFEGTVDVLANPQEEVLVYDPESWVVWKEVWDTFERDGVPRTDDLNTMQRCVQYTACSA